MKLSKLLRMIVATMVFSSGAFVAETSDFDDALLDIQHQWAKVNYSFEGKMQTGAFEALIEDAIGLVKAYPERAEALVWYGIIQSSYAGAKGGLGALSHAKIAKKSFESAIKMDDTVLQGSAYTSLGILYHKVPGWPIAFGDDDDAKQFLEKALSLNPTGIDPNYFYAEFLFDEKEYEQAIKYLEVAKNAPARESRPLADKSRRIEVETLMAKVEKKLNTKKT